MANHETERNRSITRRWKTSLSTQSRENCRRGGTPDGILEANFRNLVSGGMTVSDSVSDLDRAQDPSTPPDDLGKLACSDDQAVALAAADNPNTPGWAKLRVQTRMGRSSPVRFDTESAPPRRAPSFDDRKIRSTAAGRVHLADGWSRFFGYLLDLVIAFVGSFVVPLPLTIVFVAPNASESLVAVVGVLTFVTFWGTYLAYFAVSYRNWGQTLGMRLMSIRVLDTISGANLSWGRSIARALVLQLWVLPFAWIVYLIWTFSDTDKRGPQDLAGRDFVVSVASGRKVFLDT